MRIIAFSDIDCIQPAPFAEITLSCTYKELHELLQELQGSFQQQVKVVVLRKDRTSSRRCGKGGFGSTGK